MGRISKRTKKPSLRTQLREWSRAVRDRDGNKCFLCGSTERVQAHHILPKRMWSKYKFDPEIGVSLCTAHHAFGKYSIHRGAGDILLFLKLQQERPLQFAHLKDIVLKEQKETRANG